MRCAWLGLGSIALCAALSNAAVAEEDEASGHELFRRPAFRQWWEAARERADTNDDGTVDVQERAAFRRRLAERRRQLRQAIIARFDANGNGRLERPELRRLHEALKRHPAFRDRLEDLRDRAEDIRDRREDVRDRREDVIDNADARGRWFRWRRDRWEDVRDRREDVRDRREDVRDRREDVRDRQHDGGRRDRLEDYLDRMEDIRDRREDVRDRREDVRDRRFGPRPRRGRRLLGGRAR